MFNIRPKDIEYMTMAMRLAKKAEGLTDPNPIVGCIIVKNGRIVGQGYHKKAGHAHAEINALNAAGVNANHADMYVTLEPCAHFGKTPPCTDAIIKNKIKNVYIAMKDPNPVNNGRGIRKLRNNGVKVILGVCKDEAERMNKPFAKRITKGIPFITLKMAQSLDGKIATRLGESKWISDQLCRNYVRFLRAKSDGVMVGINTVIKDNPLLLPTIARRKNPIRIIVDARLEIPLNSKVVKTARAYKVIVAAAKGVPENKIKRLCEKGVDIVLTRSLGGRVDIKNLVKMLAKIGIMNLLFYV